MDRVVPSKRIFASRLSGVQSPEAADTNRFSNLSAEMPTSVNCLRGLLAGPNKSAASWVPYTIGGPPGLEIERIGVTRGGVCER